jgi:hypothetical protein
MAKSLLIMRLGSFAVMTVFALLFTTANASEMPKSWPWKGVAVNNITYTPEKLVALKKSLPNMNSVRLTLLPRQTATTKHLSPDEVWKDMAIWTNKMLDVCAKEGIVAIISIHEFPVDPRKNIDQTSPEFWGSEAERKNVLNYVDRMTKEFSPRGDELIAFDVLSEPMVAIKNQPMVPKEWPNLMLGIVSTIRKSSNKWITVTPGPGGFPRGYANFSPLSDKRIIYNAHMYEPHTFSLQGIREVWPIGPVYPGRIGLTYWDKKELSNTFQPLKEFQQKYQVPIWMGEFSAAIWAKGSTQYVSDIIAISNSNLWGWTYFDIDGFTAWNPNFNSNNPSKDTSVTNVGHASERWQMLNSVLGVH